MTITRVLMSERDPPHLDEARTGEMPVVPSGGDGTPFRPSLPPPPPASHPQARPSSQTHPHGFPVATPYPRLPSPPAPYPPAPYAPPAPSPPPPPPPAPSLHAGSVAPTLAQAAHAGVAQPAPLRVPWSPPPSFPELTPRRAEASVERAPDTTPNAAPPRAQAFEVVFRGDDRAALERARAALATTPPRPRGLIPRLGRAALAAPPPRPDDWWLEPRALTVAELRATCLFEGEGPALAAPAVIVGATFTPHVALSDELLALRAALVHLTSRHKAVRDALDATGDIEGGPLTPGAVLRAGIAELVRGAESAGLSAQGLRDTARQSLVRSRRYRRVDILGEDHIVLHLTEPSAAPSTAAGQVAYLSASAASHLPLAIRFDGRAIVTVHPRHDPEQAEPLAVRIHALARHHSLER